MFASSQQLHTDPLWKSSGGTTAHDFGPNCLIVQNCGGAPPLVEASIIVLTGQNKTCSK